MVKDGEDYHRLQTKKLTKCRAVQCPENNSLTSVDPYETPKPRMLLSDSIHFKTLKKGVYFAVLSSDLDECNSSIPVCHESATCQNTIASYRCLCNRTGFIYQDGKGCVGEYSTAGSAKHRRI